MTDSFLTKWERVIKAMPIRTPLCRGCADSDGWCSTDGKNCGFAKGHPLYRAEATRPIEQSGEKK